MRDPLFDQPAVARLLDGFLILKNRREAASYLRDLLTEEEILEFSRRLQAATMLEERQSYTKITARTGLSSTTIARISKWLKGPLGGYSLIIDRLRHTSPPSR